MNAIIIELNGEGARYGFDEKEIHKSLINFGFNPYLYNPIKREFTLTDNFGTHNTIYIRDINFVKDRVKG